MSAIVPAVGKSRQLDGRAEPDEVITPEDAADSTKLARLLIRILRELAAIRRRWWPRVIYFRDIDTSTAGKIRLPHGFGGRVNWWPSEVDAAADVKLGKDAAATDGNTLVLTSSGTSVVTIRVEEAG